MKKALILHAWFSTPKDNWYSWLKAELEKKGYEVWLPELPTMPTKDLDLEAMLKFIMEHNFVDKETVVIGHSLGSVVAMRLAENIEFGKAILLAAWDFNDLTPEHACFWTRPIDHLRIRSNVKELVITISDNDPFITSLQAEEMAKRFGAKVLRVGTRGHYGAEDGVTEVPEILEFV